MSSLIRQSHANNEQPLWASASGSGNAGIADATAYNLVTTTGTPADTAITSDNTTNGIMVLQGDIIRFGKVGNVLTNSGIVTSAQGSNLDSLQIGGVITTNGPLNSAGLIMQNAQHISMLDGQTPQNESFRLTAGTAGPPYPGGSFAVMETGLGGTIYFSALSSITPNTSITVSGDGGDDAVVVGGDLETRTITLNNNDLVNPVYGSATLTAGLATITTGKTNATSIILLTRTGVNASTFLGELRIREKNIGNFVVESTNPSAPPGVQTADESSFDWIIINTV